MSLLIFKTKSYCYIWNRRFCLYN